jgi:glucose-1-phosphate cytidylyltransferase
MKVVILAGGFGTRLSEETDLRPKPMVEIGGKPILWHIMNHYAHFGFREFVIALGYKGEQIKKYFLDFQLLSGDVTVDLETAKVEVRDNRAPGWKVHLVDTGADTNTGGRLRRLQPWLGNEPFHLTYGDGVADLDLGKLSEFHREHGRTATLTAVRPPSRFGGLEFDGDIVTTFMEKPQIGEGWIHGGYMVFQPDVFRHLESDGDSLERVALERLADEKQLMAHRHSGFWHCMDTIRDVRYLESLWSSEKAPWKIWK